jgi:predicted  nucleic acid-binding Zn-ribbon protein
MQQKGAGAAAQEKISSLENDKVLLQAQLREALERSKTLEKRFRALQTAFYARATNVASALEQIDYLNSELGTAAAERFKLVAALHGEKRRHNQKHRFWKTKSNEPKPRSKSRRCRSSISKRFVASRTSVLRFLNLCSRASTRLPSEK